MSKFGLSLCLSENCAIEWFIADTLLSKLCIPSERGFAICRREKPWCKFYDWPKESELPNELVPLRPLLCTFVWLMIGVTDSFAHILRKTIQLPGEIFPGLNYYSRGHHDQEFLKIPKVLENCWWCDTEPTDARKLSDPK
jgi:hypothetical protein